MKLKMAENSLFAILLRSPWWISIGIAAVIGLIAGAGLPKQYLVFGFFAGAPFLLIGAIAAWKQLRAPSAAHVADALQMIGSMSWHDFSGTIEEAFRRDGYEITRLAGPATDFAITKSGRTALVSCRRWKAASNGIEPLRDLHAAMETREAHEGIYVAMGEITSNAQRFANEKKIRLLRGDELAQLLLRMGNTMNVKT